MKFLKSKPKWLQYSLIGAISYPSLILILFLLAFITTPLNLRYIFEQIIKIALFPVSQLSLIITYSLIKNPMDYLIPMILLIIIFTLIIGALIGFSFYILKQTYNKIKKRIF